MQIAGLPSDLPERPSVRTLLRSTSWRLRALLMVAVLAPVSLAGWVAWYQHGLALSEARVVAQRSVIALEEHASNVLQIHELILRQVAGITQGWSCDRISRDKAMQRTLADLTHKYSQVSNIGIADAAGNICISAVPIMDRNLPVTNRDYFIAHQSGKANGIYFSESFTSRRNGKPHFAVSFGRADLGSPFDGIIYATVSLDHFIQFWKQFIPSVGYLIPMIREDGTFLVRYPLGNQENPLNPNGPVMTNVRKAPRGLFESTSWVDGVKRINAYSKVEPYPLFISYSVDYDTALQKWRQDLIPGIVMAALAAAALSALWFRGVGNAYSQNILQDKLRQLAGRQENIREEERSRIAREVHDELGAVLTGVRAHLSVASLDAASGAGVNPAMLRDAVALVDVATGTVRRLISDLRPSVLDHLGVWAAIEWYAGHFEERSGLPCVCTISKNVNAIEISAERSTMLFRVVQEALTNVIRHAHATRVSIQVVLQNEKVVVDIVDDGKGMRVEELMDQESWGVIGMYERARYCGCELKITGVPKVGTTVSVIVPAPRSP